MPPDPPALREAKRVLRRQLLARRRAISSSIYQEAGERVARHIAEAPELAAPRRVALYAALPDELPTRPLFERLLEQGKTCLLPRCTAGGALEFVRVDQWGALSKGRYGVLAPPENAPSVELGAGDLAIVPGVGFTRGGERLGRGQGYYDRTFPEGRISPFLMGIAFKVQLVDAIPTGELDRRMDSVATEEGILR